MSRKAIGGLFGQTKKSKNKEQKSIPFDKNGNIIFTSHARGAINYLVNKLEPERVWLPSYLCPSMLAAVEEYKTRFFPISGRLKPKSTEWIGQLDNRDLVCTIDYFGFRSMPAVKRQAKIQGAWVLEDACQALLTTGVGSDADFVLYSPRKFVGVPDGGLLIDKKKILPTEPVFDQPDPEWRIPQINAWMRRGQFDQRGGDGADRSWFQLYKKAKQNAPVKPQNMSSISADLLYRAFDYKHISEKREKNYNILQKNIGGVSLRGRLDEGIVPLGFAIYLKNEYERNEIKKSLIENKIYPPVHWDIKNSVPKHFKESHSLSKRILTIPVDQRYEIRDMERIINVLNK